MTFKYHTENLRLLEYAIEQIQRELRLYISKENRESELVYTRILSSLVVSWTEVSLLKLICQRRVFTSDEERSILRKRTLESKWKYCLELAFRKSFSIPTGDLNFLLPFTFRNYYKELRRIIDNDFIESIEVRNRVSHGQWKYAFNTELTSLSNDLMRIMNLENIISLQMKMKILKSLTSLINDICISKELLQRDFDKKYRVIDEQVNNLHKRDYRKYKIQMIEKYNRGIQKRDENTIIAYSAEHSPI